MTEFESNLSTIYDSGHVMLPSDPLNTDCDWSCEKTGVTRPAEEVKEQLAKIGMELEVCVVANTELLSIYDKLSPEHPFWSVFYVK